MELELRKKPYLKEKAQQREKAGKKIEVPAGNITSGSNEKGETNEKIARAAGTSRKTVDKVEDIFQAGKEGLLSDEQVQKARTEQTSIEYMWKTATRAEDHKDTPELPLIFRLTLMRSHYYNYNRYSEAFAT